MTTVIPNLTAIVTTVTVSPEVYFLITPPSTHCLKSMEMRQSLSHSIRHLSNPLSKDWTADEAKTVTDTLKAQS